MKISHQASSKSTFALLFFILACRAISSENSLSVFGV